jgi:hypothetical protein
MSGFGLKQLHTERLIAGGDGLFGGGNLESNIFISMHPPSSITSSSTNVANGTTHTHAITSLPGGLTAAGNFSASGNIGIGTTAPTAPLHVIASSTTLPTTNGLFVYQPTNAAGRVAVAAVRTSGTSSKPFYSWDIEGVGGWGVGMDHGTDGTNLLFRNSWNFDTSFTRMVLSSGGDLTVNGTVSASSYGGLPTASTSDAGIVQLTTGTNNSGTTNAPQSAALKALADRFISGGNGLTGGGSLQASRALSLGTPSSLTSTSTNSTTSTSHTHQISSLPGGLTAAGSLTANGVLEAFVPSRSGLHRGILLRTDQNQTGDGMSIEWVNSSDPSNIGARISGERQSGGNGISALRFYTKEDQQAGVQPLLRMSILSTGAVGINTDAPSGRFQVLGGDTRLGAFAAGDRVYLSFIDSDIVPWVYNSRNIGLTSRPFNSAAIQTVNVQTTVITGYDYAECFEWADGNPNKEDRIGMTVVPVEGGKIMVSNVDTIGQVIGVVSATYGILGDAATFHWTGKYQQDEFGRVLKDGDGNPLVSPDYDSSQEYIPRTQRHEWAPIGLMGKVRVREGQPVPDRWVRLKNFGNVSLWLIR